MTPSDDIALEFRRVDILFARDGKRRTIERALSALDAGGTREEIARTLGVTVGVAGADLAVRRGEISVLMGLSGSGKSTLLRAANRLNLTTRGEVLIGNGLAHVDIARCDEDTLRELRKTRIAMVFQQFGLLPWRTVRDNVGFALEIRGIAPSLRRKIVDEKLELVGLSRWADSYVHELSGGMQQRTGLARAFATDADILLMDEPFSALDPLIRRKLQDELLDLQTRLKKTILFVSHDIDEALKIGSHVTIMREGRIEQSGTPEQIVRQPANPYVGEFVRHINPLPSLTARLFMRPLQGLGQWENIPGTALRIRPDAQGVEADVQPPTAALDTSLGEIITARQISGLPVLVMDQGSIVGWCDTPEIMTALSGHTPAA